MWLFQNIQKVLIFGNVKYIHVLILFRVGIKKKSQDWKICDNLPSLQVFMKICGVENHYGDTQEFLGLLHDSAMLLVMFCVFLSMLGGI